MSRALRNAAFAAGTAVALALSAGAAQAGDADGTRYERAPAKEAVSSESRHGDQRATTAVEDAAESSTSAREIGLGHARNSYPAGRDRIRNSFVREHLRNPYPAGRKGH